MQYVSNTAPSGTTFNTTTQLWTVGNLNAGQSKTLTLVLKGIIAGSQTNCAEVTASSPYDNDSTPNNQIGTEDDYDCIPVVVTPPPIDLEVAKSVDDATANGGQTVTYTITVTNTSANNATNVQIKDLIPTGLTHSGYSAPSGTTYNTTTGIWNIGNLNAGQSKMLTISIVTPTNINAPTTYTNCAEVFNAFETDSDSAPNNNSTTEDDDDCEPIVVTPPQIDLEVNKSVDNTTQNTGGTVIFTVTVLNNSAINATNVTVYDKLPACFTYVSDNASSAGSGSLCGNGVRNVGEDCDGGVDCTASCTCVGGLGGGRKREENVDTPIKPLNGGEINTPNACPMGTVCGNGIHELGESCDDGNTINTDACNNTCTGGGRKFEGSEQNAPQVGSYNSTTGLWNIGNISAGQSVSLQITATVNGACNNCAEVAGATQSDVDSTPLNGLAEDDRDCADVNPPNAPKIDLELTKTVNNASPSLGGQVSFTITVNNTSAVNATGLQVKDILNGDPSGVGLLYASHSTATGTYDPINGIWDIGNLNANTTTTLTLVALAYPAKGGGAAQNCTEVSQADQSDIDSTPNNDSTSEDDDACVSVNPSCTTPSFSLGFTPATCNLTTGLPRNNARLNLTAITNADKADYATGATYNGNLYPAATPISGATQTFTNLPNPTSSQVYTVRAFNGGDTCFTDQSVTLTPTTQPIGSAVSSNVTCNTTAGGTNSDGSITLTGFIANEKYGIAVGSTFMGNDPTGNPIPTDYASAITIPANGIIINNLPNPTGANQIYTIRIFNSSGCFVDKPVTLNQVTGCTPPPSCSLNAPVATTTCNNNGTPSNPSDDTFSYNITVNGSNTGASYGISGGDTRSGLTYGSVQGAFGSFPISGGNLSLNITDVSNTGCTTHTIVDAPMACSTAGNLNISKIVTGKPIGFTSPSFSIVLDCSDNTYDQTISLQDGGNQTINNIPNGITCTITEPTTPTPPTNYTYGTPVISPSSVTITTGTTITVSVTNPLTAIPCVINNFTVTPSCNDNGTPNTAANDYRTFNLNLNGTSVTSPYVVSVNNGATITPNAGTYGTATSFRLQDGSAGNGTTYNITVTDGSDATCKRTRTVSDPGSCSNPTVGTLTIQKIVTGKPGGFTSPSFSIVLDCSDDAFDQTLVLMDGESQSLSNLPNGMTCSITEPTTPTPPTNYTYGTPIISPSTVTIVAATTVTMNVTNPLAIVPCSINGFAVSPVCNNNSTNNTTADDYRTFTLNPTGTRTATSYNVNVNNGGNVSPTTGNYGTATTFQLQNGSAGNGTTYTLTLTDATNSSCTQTATISDPGSCSTPDPVCALNQPITSVTCDGKGTSDVSDDTYSYNITVTGSNTATTYGISGGDTQSGLAYGASQGAFGNFLISSGGKNLTITDATSGSCTTSASLTAPATCSPAAPVCSLSNPITAATCNDNGTPSNPADDTFSYNITVNGNNTGATYGITGGDTRSGLTYGTSQGAFGSFPISGGNLSLNIADVANAGCTTNTTVTAPASCSNQVACTMNDPVVVAYCNTNGTASAADDTFGYTISATGTGVSALYDVMGDDVRNDLAYVTENGPFGWYPLSQGALVLNVIDNVDTGCSNSAVVIAPDDCTFCTDPTGICVDNPPGGTCTITAPNVTGICNDNGTPSNPADDTFTYLVNVTHSGTDPTLLYNLSGGDSRSNLTYGFNQGPFGSFPISGGNLTLTATDADIPACTDGFIVTAPATCSSAVPQADLRVVKTASSTNVTSGQTITYTITVTNDGPDAATNVQLRDVLSSMLTYVSHTPSVGTYTLGTGIWAIPSLANGANATLMITVTVN